MPKCSFAKWLPISGSSGPHLSGPFKIVHHTTEGSSAKGAMSAFAKNRSDPHFTVDSANIYQHIDTAEGARALRNDPGGVQTNRDSAVQIELVGFAHLPKDPLALANLARLCRWIEQTHNIPKVWPAGFPRPAKNGQDPGGHNRDRNIWDAKSGHFGHCHVPENTHWDPAYSASEVEFIMNSAFDVAGKLTTPALPSLAIKTTRAGTIARSMQSTMPDHEIVLNDVEAPKALRAPEKTKNAQKSGTPQRVFNVRRDTLDFRDQMYVPSLVEVPTDISLEDYLEFKVPVLDQGAEGACTGFGLATVANYLLLRRKHVPDNRQVSPRMLYELARRYDEWPGENYSGSSARGAMKGWNKHGVCAELDWPYAIKPKAPQSRLTEKRMEEAKKRPLGAYFRVNHKDLIAMHSAIAEVGVLYATATVHEGWQNVGVDGVINFSEASLGGHAFAVVAYDNVGFWIQNSWGESWGREGMARIAYDDWLENGTDVWVARLGAPVLLTKPMSFATAHASTSGQSSAYTYADLRPHLVSVGNDGKLKPGGDYGTSAAEIATIFEEDIPRLLNTNKKKRLLLFAHGGLVGEAAAVQRVAEYRSVLLAAGVYPLAFMWHSDYWSTITNILQDSVRRRRPEGLLDKAKDFMLDRLDDALEPVARYLSGKAAWSEMKENALLASEKEGAVRLVLSHIVKLKKTFKDLELHIVGHSAGSILHAPLIQLLTTAGKIKSGPMKGETGLGIELATCTLWAPACTADLFKETYLPAIESKGIKEFSMYCLNDKVEQDDNCARIYNKSLLYLVSNAFEKEERIPGFREGVPILGMEKTVLADPVLKKLFSRGNSDLVIAPNNEPKASRAASKAEHHGDFDDDIETVTSTFNRILGGSLGKKITKTINETDLIFAHSSSSLVQKRVDIDYQTKK